MKNVVVSGKRKHAIARASLSEGKGIVRVNKIPLEVIKPAMVRLKLQEPIILAGDTAKKFDIDVIVSGGGTTSQVEASKLVISKALMTQDKKLEKVFLDYDRQLLVADVRRKETRKPNRHGKARAKRQKSYR